MIASYDHHHVCSKAASVAETAQSTSLLSLMIHCVMTKLFKSPLHCSRSRGRQSIAARLWLSFVFILVLLIFETWNVEEGAGWMDGWMDGSMDECVEEAERKEGREVGEDEAGPLRSP